MYKGNICLCVYIRTYLIRPCTRIIALTYSYFQSNMQTRSTSTQFHSIPRDYLSHLFSLDVRAD